jgi:hypothetical protein
MHGERDRPWLPAYPFTVHIHSLFEDMSTSAKGPTQKKGGLRTRMSREYKQAMRKVQSYRMRRGRHAERSTGRAYGYPLSAGQHKGVSDI